MSTRDRACVQLLSKCNMHCRFCNVWTRTGQLAPALVRRLIAELVHLGVRHIDLTGGEPLLYEGLPELVSFTKSEGALCSVTTNGLLLDVSTVQALSAAGLDHLQMSLDGINGTHDRLRGLPGAFAAATKALPALAAFPGNRNIAVAVNHDNAEQLPAIEALADQYNLGIWFTPAAAYTDKIAAAIRPADPTTLERVAQSMNRPRSQEKLGWIVEALRGNGQGQCKVPDIRYTILADATLAPCAFLPGHGNLASESIASIADSKEFAQACNQAKARCPSACRGCYIWSTR